MSQGFFMITETDYGSKAKVKKKIGGIPIGIDAELREKMAMWWEKVKEHAKQLCLMYGAFDTFTLYDSIRIEDVSISVGGPPYYEVFIETPVHKELINSRIVVGGPDFINPKTGRPCNYAESVHDGTGKNINKGPRPFLTDAINANINELYAIVNKGVRKTVLKVGE